MQPEVLWFYSYAFEQGWNDPIPVESMKNSLSPLIHWKSISGCDEKNRPLCRSFGMFFGGILEASQNTITYGQSAMVGLQLVLSRWLQISMLGVTHRPACTITFVNHSSNIDSAFNFKKEIKYKHWAIMILVVKQKFKNITLFMIVYYSQFSKDSSLL